MKKGITLAVVLAALCALVSSCSPSGSSGTHKFIVVDRGSGRIVSSYEYRDGASRPCSIDTYRPNGSLSKSYQLSYDEQNRLRAAAVTDTSVRGIPSSKSISYSYADTVGADGKLAGTEQKSSEGEVVKTHYGYDETGALRGVVQEAKDGLMMKDYAQ